jgi:hypothetical protein
MTFDWIVFCGLQQREHRQTHGHKPYIHTYYLTCLGHHTHKPAPNILVEIATDIQKKSVALYWSACEPDLQRISVKTSNWLERVPVGLPVCASYSNHCLPAPGSDMESDGPMPCEW